jgi:hypothetical protein
VDYFTDSYFQNSIKSIERDICYTLNQRLNNKGPPETGKRSCPKMITKAASSDSFKTNWSKTGLQLGFMGDNCTLWRKVHEADQH